MAFKVANAHFREESTILRGMRTGLRLLTSGRLVEYDRTDKIFTNPTEKLTEDYVTGRFG